MCNELHDATWSERQLPLLVESLSRRSGLQYESAEIGSPGSDPNSISSWIDSACQKLNLESECLKVVGRDLHLRLKRALPAIIQIDERKFLALLTWRRNVAVLHGPDGNLYKIAGQKLLQFLRRPFEEPLRADLERLLDECGVQSRRRSVAAETLLQERLQNTEIVRVWELRTPPSSCFRQQLKDAGLHRKVACFVGAFFLEHSLWLASWYVIGLGAIEGRFDQGWLLAWALLLGMMIPFRIWSTWLRGYLAIGFGGLLQQRLLSGILQQKKTDGTDGIGATVGKVIESAQIEGLALTGGLLTILACLETFFAVAVLFSGAGGGVHVSLFLGLLLLTLLLAVKTMTRCNTWTETRLALTGDLVERIAGHRTRLAQKSGSEWHANEDRVLEHYLEQSKMADESFAYLAGPVPRVWLVIGLAGLLPALLSADVPVSSLAVGIGGILLGQQALHRFCQSIGSLIGAGIAWKQVRSLFRAGGKIEPTGRWLPPVERSTGFGRSP